VAKTWCKPNVPILKLNNFSKLRLRSVDAASIKPTRRSSDNRDGMTSLRQDSFSSAGHPSAREQRPTELPKATGTAEVSLVLTASVYGRPGMLKPEVAGERDRLTTRFSEEVLHERSGTFPDDA